MGWVLIAIAVVALAVIVVYGVRGRSKFDTMISPPDDLRRADDGYRPTLAERDGTGGFL